MKRRTIIKSLVGLFYGTCFLVKQVKASGTIVFSDAWEKGKKMYAERIWFRFKSTYKSTEDVEKYWEESSSGKMHSIYDNPFTKKVDFGCGVTPEGGSYKKELIIFKDIPGPQPYEV